MSNDTKDAVEKIVDAKLSDYDTSEKPTPVAKTGGGGDLLSGHMSKLYGRKPAKPKRVQGYRPATSYDDYKKLVPAIETPSVFSKAKVDEVLKQCKELPTPDSPQKNYAGYSRTEWDTLLEVVSRYMLDVVEGAGLHVKGGFSPDGLRADLSLTLQRHFMHHDPYDKRNRWISVDGRIDSDERKP